MTRTLGSNMGASSEGTPIPSSLIASRFVAGIGAASVLNSGIINADYNCVGMTATISTDGEALTEFSLWYLGPNVNYVMPANQLFPHISQEVNLSLDFVPADLFFFPNSSATNWQSGTDAINRGEITVEGGETNQIAQVKSIPWVFRFAIVVGTNTRSAKIMFQAIPVSLGMMDSLTDPLSYDLAVVSLPIVVAPWSHPPDPSFKMNGMLPMFRDRRAAEIKSSGILPKSQVVKWYVSKAMSTCAQNPALTPEELNTLLSDTTATPPYKSAVEPLWPPIPQDISVSTGSGVTPSQAALQSKGVPVIAKDQTLVTNAAQRNLALQAGRSLMDLDTEMPAPLSAEAQNRRDIMKNFFKDLPNDLPSWELLLAMPVTECMSFINSKIEREKEGTGDTAEVDKFLQATKPVVYSLEQTDDRMTLLHSARFLPAPLSEPVVYYPLMEKKRVPVITNLPEGAIGFDCGISDLAIRKMSDRTQPLALKHLLKSNAMVERSAPIKKARAVQGLEIGDYCESTYVQDYDFKAAEYPWEILEAMLAAVAVNAQIWPLDFSILNVLRALTNIQLFHNPRISMKLQVLMCTTFIDAAFITNSKKARAQMPPLSVKDCVELAKSTWGRLKMKEIDWTTVSTLAASNGPLLPGHDAAAFAKFELSNLGVARKKQQQQLQQQLLRLQEPAYGGGRGAQNFTGGRRTRGGKRPLVNKPAAAGSAGRRGLEICPAFSKGIPCPRGGDSKANCASSSGVVLHHLCEICGYNTHGSKNHV